MIGEDVYDVETYPNVFTACFLPTDRDTGVFFEISDRRNDSASLFYYLTNLKRMIGFRNFDFDWPIIDYFLALLAQQTTVTAAEIYQKAEAIIGSYDRSHTVWKPSIEQVDLSLIHHFDNKAKMTSLKMIEFNMRSRSIEDLPFEPGTMLRPDQIDTLLRYNGHDVTETKAFWKHTLPMIEFREKLGPEYLNYNDTKIGKQFFIKELEAVGVQCFERGRNPRQTHRSTGVPLADIILPYIEFERPEMQQTLEWFLAQRVFDTKGTLETAVSLDGFEMALGLGGIHGSVSKQTVTGMNVLDLDVAGYYPSIAIENRLFPAHLGERFCDVYASLRQRRKTTPREDIVTHGTLKLAQNGVFGDSNNPYSPFLDPAFMLAITVNGQLMLCMLAEKFSMISGVRMIQINTDGITLQFPDTARSAVEAVCSWWQGVTRLDLEYALYDVMFIRDVNNYLARTVGGKIKRKGVYDYEMRSGSIGGQVAWNKNFSSLVIPKAACAAMLDDTCPESFIHEHDDPWDFLLRTKVPRSSRLELGDGTVMQNITRYYISVNGQPLVKVMPALRGKTEPRRIGVHAEGQATAIGIRGDYRCSKCGEAFRILEDFNLHNKTVHCWLVTPCNVFEGDLTGLDHRYYVDETEKLLIS